MNKFSLVIITLNEEANIERCIKGVPNADEVIVVDSGSEDKTVEIAKAAGAKVIHQEWLGYGKQKQFAIDQARNDWVFLLDADEFINEEMAKSLDRNMNQDYYHAFRMPRKELFLGKALGHGRGFSNPVRFHRKSSGRMDDEEIHEQFITDKPIGDLDGFALHPSAPTVIDRLNKILRDTTLEKAHHSVEITWTRIWLDPIRYFLSNLIKRKSYLDGKEGVVLLALYSFQMFIQNIAFYEKNKGL